MPEVWLPRKTRGWTPVEKLEFAMKWENIRVAYFKEKGDNEKADELTQKIKFIKVELTIAGYHLRDDSEAVFYSH